MPAGSRWRLLVHDAEGKAFHVTSNRAFGGPVSDSPSSTVTVLPGTEFDELVLGEFLHLEQMDTGRWWLNVAGLTVWIEADPDGKPTSVNVYGPGDYDEPVEGVRYGGPALADEWPPKRGG